MDLFLLKLTISLLFGVFPILKEAKGSSIDTIIMIEENLTSKLFNTAKYNKHIRPSKQTRIDLSIGIQQMVSVDEKNQILTLNMYVNQQWLDTRLSWNEYEYGNISQITVIAKSIWLPDTTILNSADDGSIKPNDNTYAYIQSDGSVYLTTSSAVTRVRCSLNMKHFPFDTQICTVKFQSWCFTSDLFNLTFSTSGVYIKQFIKNEIWDLVSYTGKTYSENNDGYDYIAAELEIHIARRPLFYIINILVPCFALNILSLIAFFLPYAQQITLCEY